MNTLIKSTGLLCAFLMLAGCGGGKNKTNIELIQDMMVQASYKSQDYDDVKKEGSNRLPPDGVVPRGQEVYMYSGDPAGAESNLKNPLAGLPDAEWMARGAEKFRIYCSVCHGSSGKGDGPIAAKMSLKPPALVSDKVKQFRDGRIYHILHDGQGVMGSYASQIQSVSDRWAVVNYIRYLQKTDGAR
jgi:mono/diheme cytochrome c family protein